MPPAPLPHNELQRLNNLRQYQILDSLPEKEFDEIVKFAARSFNVPIAAISLVDANRQWFKASCGLAVCETSRDAAFCAHTILSFETMIIEDAHLDSRFANNPLVTGDPFIRFYAGHPLTTPEGFNIGTLCVIDRQPRKMNEQELTKLAKLAENVTMLLGLRLSTIRLQRSVEANPAL
jgi:GAF domain-containing protein